MLPDFLRSLNNQKNLFWNTIDILIITKTKLDDTFPASVSNQRLQWTIPSLQKQTQIRDKDDDITRILQKYLLPDGFENLFVELNLFLNKKDFHAKFCQILENLNTNSS